MVYIQLFLFFSCILQRAIVDGSVRVVWPAKIATDSINYTASAYRFHHVAVVLTIAIFGPPSQICISPHPLQELATFPGVRPPMAINLGDRQCRKCFLILRLSDHRRHPSKPLTKANPTSR